MDHVAPSDDNGSHRLLDVSPQVMMRRETVRRYYASHSHQIVKRKTLQKVMQTGRKVSEKTMAKNGIYPDEIEAARRVYLLSKERE